MEFVYLIRDRLIQNKGHKVTEVSKILRKFKGDDVFHGCVVPRGGTLIFSHIRRLGPFFWVQNSEFQYFLGF